jgi:hypothetical protein
MMLELEIDSPFCGRKCNILEFLVERNFVYLRHILGKTMNFSFAIVPK